MESRRGTRFSPWILRAAGAAGAAVAAAILAFYVARMFVPLPIFAADAGSYLIRALYTDEAVVRNPLVTAVTNGVHLSLIRAAWRLGALTGWPYMLVDKIANAAIYLAGLVGLWQACTKSQAPRERGALLILALGFAYYRFAFSNLAEGPFVGVLALILVMTRAWYWRRPMVHALAAGVGCAALVLVKPHGLATVAALGAVAFVEAATSRDWRRFALRAALFAAAFLAAGNAIQFAAQEPVANPLLFFMSGFYAGALSAAPPGGVGPLAGQALAIMTFSALLLAGPPIVIGAAELIGRWRGEGPDFRLKRRDLVFLILLGSLAATLAMVTIFAMKVASTPSETHRLWGRYFEFYAPMLWLSAAPALGRPQTRGLGLACGAVALVALAGLLSLLQRGWVVLPWDSAVLTAFFAPDPARAPMVFDVPYRGLAAAAGLIAAGALALKARPAFVGAAFLLTLSGLSTSLDHAWLGEFARQRYALSADLDAIERRLPPTDRRVVLITPDANVAHLAFLRLGAQPYVVLGEAARPPAGALEGAAAVVGSGIAVPPGAWTAAYQGRQLSLWTAAPLPAGP